MRRHARSDRIGTKAGAGGAAAAAAEIGSRVFPLPAPAPAPMPAVGARRSTRVFVPKAKPTAATPAAARVLRSGKRLAFSGPLTKPSDQAAGGDADAWLRWGQRSGKNGWHVTEEEEEEEEEEASESVDEKVAAEEKPQPTTSCVDSPASRSFEIVYSRKRRRQRADAAAACSSSGKSETEERRFGKVFRRKEQRRKRAKFSPLAPELAIAGPARVFAANVGFLEGDFLTRLDGSSNAVVLAALVDSLCAGSSCRFSRFLASVLRWMRRRPRAKVRELTMFLLSGGIAGVFSLHGVHFLALRLREDGALPGNASLPCGFCEIYGAKKSVPLLLVDFSALPSYFQSLHFAILLDSLYLPAVIRRSVHLVGGVEEMYSHDPLEADSLLPGDEDVEETDDLGRNGSSRLVQEYTPLEQVAGVVVHGLRLKKHQRKRSSSRHPLNRQRLSVRFLGGAVGLKQGVSANQSEANPSLPLLEPVVEPVRPKAALEISLDLLDNVDDSDISTPVGSNGKQKRSALKSPVERVNERLALAEVRQNIDSVRCKANLLIIQADRCWREEGAEVMLEVSDSNEWCIAVKIQGTTRISHKPSELKCCVVNRFTHAYMWAIDEGWKIEFLEKWDWLLFKELHIVGRERNSQGKIIPIPGVCEVSDDMEQIVTDPFIRPEPDYIRMSDDEVGRALRKDSIYDMDSDDEEWLSQLNPADSDEKSSHLNHISPKDFEKIITTFEKNAYNSSEGTNDPDRLSARCQDLGKDDTVLAVYDYWINKRNKKGVPLLKIFQGAPQRRAQLSQKPSIKKKRSFKRQRSQAGRGKPEAFLQDSAEEGALRRVQEAESAAKHAVETAIWLRNRAQALMANADMATYKSVMALRIAEAARVSDSSPDLASSILDSREEDV